jgi:nitrite reductase (NO-forming)
MFDVMVVAGFALLIGLVAVAGVLVARGGTVEPAAAASAEPIGEIEITATDNAFNPAALEVDEPGVYTVTVINEGLSVHDFSAVDGSVQVPIGVGETITTEVTVTEDGFDFFCNIPGHREAGMVGRISLAGQTTTTAHAEDSHGGAPVVESIEADPNAPPYVLRDPVAPLRGEGTETTIVVGGAPDGGDVIEIVLPIVEQNVTVATGYAQAAWTFGGTVPGPVIRARVGDLIRVRLMNPPEAQLSHSIDFHASLVAWNDEMRSIAPGEELIYEFRANFAGVWMYHCGTNPTLHHIANGMYGMIIVEPTEGLEPVDREYAFVQSEWYLGEQGQPASLTKAQASAPAPDLVMFNGVGSQYLDNPVPIDTGERVRLYVLNVGPSVDSSFHIVGTIFDRVIKEGVELAIGNPGNWGSQAVDLSPAQGAVVEFLTAEDGLYPFVTHAFNFVGRGAIGLFQSGDGDPTN